ncbi:MAG: hypothetical protein FWC73_13380 [Defluviitaleaceae bacterium]|nr:hypothetical protein [Defluviitaleaceae bacterium]
MRKCVSAMKRFCAIFIVALVIVTKVAFVPSCDYYPVECPSIESPREDQPPEPGGVKP